MTEARRRILEALDCDSVDEYSTPDDIRPAFIDQSSSLTLLLRRKLEAVHASVDVVSSAEQIGGSIVDFLTVHDSPLEVGVVPGVDTDSIPAHLGIVFSPCEEFTECRSVITTAAFGIAETGTVVMPSSIQRPTLANFLPDNCIVLLDEVNIRSSMEEAFSSVQNSDSGMPRALNLISGPSKTADIEQTLVYGAHGPIQLHVIIRTL